MSDKCFAQQGSKCIITSNAKAIHRGQYTADDGRREQFLALSAGGTKGK